jgi:hypothetical protein
MSDLRERFQELAEVAARQGRTPAPGRRCAAPAGGGCS